MNPLNPTTTTAGTTCVTCVQPATVCVCPPAQPAAPAAEHVRHLIPDIAETRGERLNTSALGAESTAYYAPETLPPGTTSKTPLGATGAVYTHPPSTGFAGSNLGTSGFQSAPMGGTTYSGAGAGTTLGGANPMHMPASGTETYGGKAATLPEQAIGTEEGKMIYRERAVEDRTPGQLFNSPDSILK
eukprot:tig00001215_g7578.t1